MIPLPVLFILLLVWIGGFFISAATQWEPGAWIFIYIPLILICIGTLVGIVTGDSSACGRPGAYC